MGKYDKLKESAYAGNMRIEELGLVLFTFGNVSAADRENRVFAIKPSGVPYADLQPSDMIVADYNGKVIEGDLRPSSDTRTHAVLYKNWEGIGGVAHTHSTYATAWAQTLKDIPILGTTHADHLAMDIPCTPPMDDDKIIGDYEYQTGEQILAEFKNREISYNEAGMILVGSHAPFTWGSTPEIAVYNSAVLEEVAKMAYLTLRIRPDAPRMKETLIRKHFERKHGKDAYYGQG